MMASLKVGARVRYSAEVVERSRQLAVCYRRGSGGVLSRARWAAYDQERAARGVVLRVIPGTWQAPQGGYLVRWDGGEESECMAHVVEADALHGTERSDGCDT